MVKDNKKSFNMDWEWAISNNSLVPFLEKKVNNVLEVIIPISQKKKISEYISFVKENCYNRQVAKNVSKRWSLLCDIRSVNNIHYTPRWTFPVFYFRDEFKRFFKNKNGLDIGARVNDLESIAKIGLLFGQSNNQNLIETLVPHYQYYIGLGCHMFAIDILNSAYQNKNIEYGDARLLNFESESFDFITMPMILGHNNACNTYLEIALCLSELKRVLRLGGFVYIADAGFQPTIGFAAQCMNFDLYISKGSSSGLPVGTILRKQKCDDLYTLFDDLFLFANIKKLSFNEVCDEIALNCNLFFDKEDVIINSLS